MKWMMPSFLVSIITMIAVALNQRLLWDLEPTQIVASVTVAINFVGVTLLADIAKIKRGEMPNWNSTKLFTTVFALLLIGFSDYIGIHIDEESIWFIAGSAATFITGKGIRDITARKEVEPIAQRTDTFESNR